MKVKMEWQNKLLLSDIVKVDCVDFKIDYLDKISTDRDSGKSCDKQSQDEIPD